MGAGAGAAGGVAGGVADGVAWGCGVGVGGAEHADSAATVARQARRAADLTLALNTDARMCASYMG